MVWRSSWRVLVENWEVEWQGRGYFLARSMALFSEVNGSPKKKNSQSHWRELVLYFRPLLSRLRTFFCRVYGMVAWPNFFFLSACSMTMTRFFFRLLNGRGSIFFLPGRRRTTDSSLTRCMADYKKLFGWVLDVEKILFWVWPWHETKNNLSMLFAQEKKNVINVNDSKNKVKCPWYKKKYCPGAWRHAHVESQ